MRISKYLFVFVFSFAINSFACSINDVNKAYYGEDACSSFESKLVLGVKSNIVDREDYCLLKRDCSVDPHTTVPLMTSTKILKEMTLQKIEDLFDEISVANKDLDSQINSGELGECSLNQFDSFPNNCKNKLEKLGISSTSLAASLSEIRDGTSNSFSPKCLNNSDRLYMNAIQVEKKQIAALVSDKKFIEQLLNENNNDKFKKLIEEKIGGQLNVILQNPRLEVILSSRDQLKSYLKGNALSEENKKAWSSKLGKNCSETFRSLKNYLCDKVPDGDFEFSDFSLNRKFEADKHKEFKDDYCMTSKKTLIVSDPFNVEKVSPFRTDSVINDTQKTNAAICPIKTKCENDKVPADCFKAECANVIANVAKDAKSKKQKTFCENLFDFKNNGTIKNQELVNFLAEKKSTTVIINGLPVPTSDSKLMNYFITPTVNSAVADKKVDKNIKAIASHGNEGTHSNQFSNNIANSNPASYSIPQQNIVHNNQPAANDNTRVNPPRINNNSNDVDVSEFQNTINAQNELLDRLERAKNMQNGTSVSKNQNSNSKINNSPTNSSHNDSKKIADPVNNADPGIAGTNSTIPTDGTNPSKTKSSERNLANNTIAPRDNTRVNNNGVSGSIIDGTSLEHKNNISSSMDVNKEGQYKVTLKNLDPKTLNMDLFKDEVKKQAKEAIDQGIPFVISIVNNDKEITINMVPKDLNGKITYIPTPKDDSAESLAFAEKLKNSFYAQGKVVKQKSSRVSVSDFNN